MTNIGKVAQIFFNFRDNLHIYHFQTKLYARHQITASVIEQLNNCFDEFLEIMQNDYEKHIEFNTNNNFIILQNFDDENIYKYVIDFRSWIINELPRYYNKNDYDLKNIRDEILKILNRMFYLFKLR